jgi:hypothetical protein
VAVGASAIVVVVSAVGERADPGRPTARTWASLMGVAAALFLLVLNLGYGFGGTLGNLAGATLDPSGPLAALRAAAPWLRLPVPIQLVNGVDQVMTSGREHEPAYFLAGELSSTGWWYYHLAAFALKTPVPVLLGALIALLRWIAGRSPGRRDYCVFVPTVLVFAFNSLFTSLDIGVRHVLAAYPLLYVAIAPLVTDPLRAVAGGSRRAGDRVAAAGVAAGLLWLAAANASVAPRYLQYANEIAGGPDRAHLLLIDSNLDWCQDLLRLRRYMAERHLESVNLAYFGRVHPLAYGVRFQPLAPTPGASHAGRRSSRRRFSWAARISGSPMARMRWMPAGSYTWLQRYRPVGRVGSMFVDDLP